MPTAAGQAVRNRAPEGESESGAAVRGCALSDPDGADAALSLWRRTAPPPPARAPATRSRFGAVIESYCPVSLCRSGRVTPGAFDFLCSGSLKFSFASSHPAPFTPELFYCFIALLKLSVLRDLTVAAFTLPSLPKPGVRCSQQFGRLQKPLGAWLARSRGTALAG